MSVIIPKMAYISGALSNLPPDILQQRRELYELQAGICERHGLIGYCPHRYTDPVKAAQFTPEEVDRRDRLAVTKSLLMIANLDLPSLGAGQEMEIARHAETAIIALYQVGRKPGRLTLGNSAIVSVLPWTDLQMMEDLLSGEILGFVRSWEREDLPQPLRIQAPVRT